MAKKIFDILPPKEFEKKKVEEFPLEKEYRPRLKKPEFKISKKLSSSFFIPLVLILIGIFCYFTLSKAEIEIWPESEVLTFETKLTIDKTAENVDLLNKVIPGKIFEAEKTITEEFSSSGAVLKEKKAEGIIRVYNDYSTSPQVLIARTRFVSADGKLFRTPTKITIPGGHYENGKFVPGYLDVQVKADQPGPEYNIGPSTFSIPGFAGTARYTKFYGKSFQAMTGGFREEVPQVTQEDLDQAQKILEEKALKDCKTALKEKISPEFILLDDILDSKIIETFSLARPKEELEKFSFQVKASSTALVFKTEDAENFARDFILSQIPEDKQLYQESLKITYSLENVNLELAKAALSLQMEAKIYSDIDTENLKKGLSRKSLTEAKLFLEDQPQITQVLVKFWPFWVKKVPEDIEKIKIKLNIEIN
ncbi:MAG: hypothetical protein E3J36_01055 [Candidatus Nealsonbacteria bacterium]|nr:MAG: hypothetical protein E3J36_01055 [Candidatus Nealsonbacteria bacterium]